MNTVAKDRICYVPEGSPLDAAGVVALRPRQPWLGGKGAERLNFFEGVRESAGVFQLCRGSDLMLGWAEVSVTKGMTKATQDLYCAMLEVADGIHLYHIWNWVPAINARSSEGEDNYRLFCQGRAQGFEKFCGAGFEDRLPSASAVGHGGESLMICFVGGRSPVDHLENPEQVPAWRYPRRFGPRSPSFARASVVQSSAGPLVWVSGTASIKGSETVCAGDFDGQVRTTLGNLDLIMKRAGKDLRRPAAGESRHFRVYLRNRRNLERARELTGGILAGTGNSVVWVEADICRNELEIEIELSAYPPGVSAPGTDC